MVRMVWQFLANRFGHKYFVVYEWVMKTEYQGRGTPHWHIAVWVLSFGLLQALAGRTGSAVVSCFVRLLELLFCCDIDVQVGNGRLNYINGHPACYSLLVLTTTTRTPPSATTSMTTACYFC